jgi:lactate dehydrogenase-like 2-hydroxyacid dehydrogenase
MPAKKPLVIVTRKLPDAIETRMRELFDTRLNVDDTPMDQAALIEAVQKADVLVPTVTDRIDSKIIVRAGPNLKLMKPSAYIVNTARGEVIDENTLARMLEGGQLAGAGLDVFEHEPAVNPKLLRLNNVVLLPHMGSATLEGRIDMGEKVIINIKTFADGHKPPDRVIPAML